MLGATPSSLAPKLAVTLLTVVAATGRSQASVAPDTPTAVTAPLPDRAQDTLTATVRSVHERSIDVITGVQLALEVTSIALDPTTVIRKQGEAVAVAALVPGDLVTIDYRNTARGKVARTIVVQALPRQDGAR